MRKIFGTTVAQSVIPDKSYADGLLEGRELGMQEMERMLVILREELGRTIQQMNDQMLRADNAGDLLLQHIGLRSISMAGIKEEGKRREQHINAVERLSSIPDPTEDLPIGDPRGTFKTRDEARIVPMPDYSKLTGADFDDNESALAGTGN